MLAQGKFNRINFRQDFYVGGYSNYSAIGERTGVDGGLVGCIRRVDVNGKQYDMRRGEFVGDALHGYDVGQSSVCLPICLSVSQFVFFIPPPTRSESGGFLFHNRSFFLFSFHADLRGRSTDRQPL